MITLDLAPYCQDCPKIELVKTVEEVCSINALTYNTVSHYNTIFHCEYEKECDRMYRYIKDAMRNHPITL